MDRCSQPGVLPALTPDALDAIRTFWKLTPRQTQVAVSVARGFTNKEVAAELACVEGTVEKHLRDVFKKTDSPNRVILAVRLWLLAPVTHP